jgi:hypothetical protein
MALTKAQENKLQNEYDQFLGSWKPGAKLNVKSLPGNREIKPQHVQKLRQLISRWGMLSAPLFVATKVYNKKGYDKYQLFNMDGQHRLDACVKENKSFNYIVVRLDNVTDIVQMMADLNNSSARWLLDDYINAYAHVPKTSATYFKLQNFTKEHSNYSTSLLAELLHVGHLRHRKVANNIKSGTFKYSYENEALHAIKLFDLVAIHAAQHNEKVKTALLSIRFRSSLLNFVTNNPELNKTDFIKGFANSLVTIKEIPSLESDWDILFKRYNDNNKSKVTIDMTKVTEKLFSK